MNLFGLKFIGKSLTLLCVAVIANAKSLEKNVMLVLLTLALVLV